ncbi:MAG: conserved hypothetical secreted protein [Rhizobium sp.]|nr:conserved hypothetical secreted protein [Rhizobium sp.]
MRFYAMLFLVALASPALASPQCTSEPKDKWLAKAVIQAKAEAMGNTIDILKTTKGNCYEVYGRNAKGKRIEIYFNPVTGKPVQES